jgi:hypothetical protein
MLSNGSRLRASDPPSGNRVTSKVARMFCGIEEFEGDLTSDEESNSSNSDITSHVIEIKRQISFI